MATARRLIGWQTVQQWLEGVPYYIAMYFAELDPNMATSRSFSVDLDTTPWLVGFNIANKSGGPFIAIQVRQSFCLELNIITFRQIFWVCLQAHKANGIR